jgi:hypothetical protein
LGGYPKNPDEFPEHRREKEQLTRSGTVIKQKEIEIHPQVAEGPIRRTREGGSEWELIKILLEGDGNSNKMNTASNTRLRLTTQVG